jgi:hypothetical protein
MLELVYSRDISALATQKVIPQQRLQDILLLQRRQLFSVIVLDLLEVVLNGLLKLLCQFKTVLHFLDFYLYY